MVRDPSRLTSAPCSHQLIIPLVKPGKSKTNAEHATQINPLVIARVFAKIYLFNIFTSPPIYNLTKPTIFVYVYTLYPHPVCVKLFMVGRVGIGHMSFVCSSLCSQHTKAFDPASFAMLSPAFDSHIAIRKARWYLTTPPSFPMVGRVGIEPT
jgi:hypothetical protein